MCRTQCGISGVAENAPVGACQAGEAPSSFSFRTRRQMIRGCEPRINVMIRGRGGTTDSVGSILTKDRQPANPTRYACCQHTPTACGMGRVHPMRPACSPHTRAGINAGDTWVVAACMPVREHICRRTMSCRAAAAAAAVACCPCKAGTDKPLRDCQCTNHPLRPAQLVSLRLRPSAVTCCSG